MNDLYIIWFNALEPPAVIIPWFIADPEKNVVVDKVEFVSKENWKFHEPSKMAGAPFGLQIVGVSE
jgi:hypothetical protein